MDGSVCLMEDKTNIGLSGPFSSRYPTVQLLLIIKIGFERCLAGQRSILNQLAPKYILECNGAATMSAIITDRKSVV